MLQAVEQDKCYVSESGFLFKVMYLAKHGQDCSCPMVVYTNLEATADQPAGQIWTISESIFLKRFSERVPQIYRFIGAFEDTTHLPQGAAFDVAMVGRGQIYIFNGTAWVLTLGDFIDHLDYELHPDSRYYWCGGDFIHINDGLFALRADGKGFGKLSPTKFKLNPHLGYRDT